jgi:mRNA interferase MazF
MTNYRAGDIVLVNFPLAGNVKSKQRPALVLLDTGDADLLLARITTQRYQTAYDVALTDWQAAGLKAPSAVRLHKLATLEKTLVQRLLGNIQTSDRQKISKVLLFANW